MRYVQLDLPIPPTLDEHALDFGELGGSSGDVVDLTYNGFQEGGSRAGFSLAGYGIFWRYNYTQGYEKGACHMVTFWGQV